MKQATFQKLPNHIGIILDGNGRWATNHGLPRKLGHKAGINSVRRTIDYALKYGIKVISFFAFSTENWNRDKEEVDGIFDLLKKWIDKNFHNENNDVRFVVSGDLSKIPQDVADKILQIVEKTKHFEKLIVNLCINYGGKDELVRAINLILKQKPTIISFDDFRQFLDAGFLPDIDFVIRTSGEQRLSNFMMMQCAYAELYFPKVLWPAFREKDFVLALKEFQSRDRRFGAIKKGIK